MVIHRKDNKKEEPPFAKIKLWKNGFDYGLKLDGNIISYSITEHIPLVKDKGKFARAFIKHLRRSNK